MKACKKARLLSLYSSSAMLLRSSSTLFSGDHSLERFVAFHLVLVTEKMVTRIDAPRVGCQDLRREDNAANW